MGYHGVNRYGGPADYPRNVGGAAQNQPRWRRNGASVLRTLNGTSRSSVTPETGVGTTVKTGSMAVPGTPELGRLEAAMFLAREPLGVRRLAMLAAIDDVNRVRLLIGELNRVYDTSGFALRIVNVAGGYQLVTRAVFAPWLRRLHGVQAEVRLSAPAMETLAIVACCQPVLRTGIEAIRGVACGDVLRQLMERDLVRITGRSEELGRPFYYGTTRRFLRIFGLRSLDDLPHIEDFANFRDEPSDTGKAALKNETHSSDREECGNAPDREEMC